MIISVPARPCSGTLSPSVTLRSGVSGHGVTVGFEGFPKPRPVAALRRAVPVHRTWLGLSDGVNFNGELPNKACISQRVNAGASRTCTHADHPVLAGAVRISRFRRAGNTMIPAKNRGSALPRNFHNPARSAKLKPA